MIHLVFDFLLNISKEVIITVISAYFISLLKKKKNHPTDKGDGSSSDN